MGLPGMVLSAIAAAAGAIMYWAITYQGTGFRLSTVGIILMIAGHLDLLCPRSSSRCREVRNGRNVILSTDKWLTHRETRVRFTKTLSRDTRPVRNVPITTDVSILRIRARQMTSDKHTYEFRKEYTQCT